MTEIPSIEKLRNMNTEELAALLSELQAPKVKRPKLDEIFVFTGSDAPLPTHPADPNTDVNIAEVYPKLGPVNGPFTANSLAMTHLGGLGGPVRRRPRTIAKVLAILEKSGHVKRGEG